MKEQLRTLYYDVVEGLCGRQGTRIDIGAEGHRESYVVPLRWRQWFGANYEGTTFEFVDEYCQRGMTFLDIGAHFGIFSIAAARRLGREGHIYSFEPCPSTRQTMMEFLRLNPIEASVEVREEAVCDSSGVQEMYFSPVPGDAANTLFINPEHRMPQKVKTISLDDFTKAHSLRINCLKIDAEGAELAILRGSRALMIQQRPTTYLALHPAQIPLSGGSLEEIWDLVISYGMQIWLPQSERASREKFCSQPDLFDAVLLPS